MNGLTANLQDIGDGLPTPAALPGIAHLHVLQPVGKDSECTHRSQPLSGVRARSRSGELQIVVHSSMKPDTLHFVN